MNESKQPDHRQAQASDPDDLLEIIVGAPKQEPLAVKENRLLPAHGGSANGTVPLSSHESTLADVTVEDEETDPPTVPMLPASDVAELEPASRYTQSHEWSPETHQASSQSVVLDEKPQENWLALLVKETLETVVLAVVIFLLIRIGVQNYRIEGSSMEPNFHDGEYLLVNKLAYRLGEYERGDVIVFKYPGDPSKDYIKRVIGLPGDTVEIRDGVLYVNGTLIDEPYQIMPMNGIPYGPVTVEPGYLYVLGDNRPASSDSRDWGRLDQDLVIGKAWLAIWPFDQFGLVDHPELHFTPGMAQGP